MRRIDSTNALPDLHGPGKAGFGGGNPGAGVRATQFTPAWCNSVQEEGANLIEASGVELDPDDDTQMLHAVVNRLRSGIALPVENIGPIWHDDYNSLMTWQVFNANGATYTGYASVLVGSLLADTQPTPRLGYVKSGSNNLSRATYAALRGWAKHNGIMVAEGVWAAGTIAVKDNVDGTTFTAYDVRAEFPRYWDDSRGVDAGRTWGSNQTGAIQSHTHTVTRMPVFGATAGGQPAAIATDSGNQTVATNYPAPINTTGGTETRPRNVALLATIKF